MYGALWLLSFQVTICDKKPGRSARELAALGYTRCEIMLRANRIGLMQDCPWKASTNIEWQTIGGYMVNDLRILLLTSVCGFGLALTGSSTTRIETMTQRATPVMVGETVPDFTLEDQSSRKITLSESRGKSSVVLVFYRGYC